MDITISLHGLKELEETISSAQDKLDELRRAVTAIDKALCGVGLEIDQPSNMEEPGYIAHPPYGVSTVLYSHKDAGAFIDCCKEE